MSRGLLLDANKPLPTEAELSFYLPRLITAYVELEKRRQRRLAMVITFWAAACVIAFTAAPDSDTVLPLVSVKVVSSVAVAGLYVLGVFLMGLSLLDRCAADAYRQELEVIHRLRYKSKSPTWYLRSPTIIETLNLLSPGLRFGRVLVFLVTVGLTAAMFALLGYCYYSWSRLPVAARVLFIGGSVLFVSLVVAIPCLKTAPSEILKQLRDGEPVDEKD